MDEDNLCVVVDSLSEKRRGVLRRPENQPRREEEGGLGRGCRGRGRWEGREMKDVMVAVKNGPSAAEEDSSEVELEVEAEAGSSERAEGVETLTWPKSRPWTDPEEEEKRWRREANVGPEIWIFVIGTSSIWLQLLPKPVVFESLFWVIYWGKYLEINENRCKKEEDGFYKEGRAQNPLFLSLFRYKVCCFFCFCSLESVYGWDGGIIR